MTSEESDFLVNFTDTVARHLPAAHLSAVGAAVSGGADSVSLLVSLAHICKKSGSLLKVITINHGIRPAEETGGDADYVQQLCRSLASEEFPVSCFRTDFAPNLVFKTAEERGAGIEEAARFLRYKAFEEFARNNSLPILCLAHNRNDQLETLLMRFLQGSGGTAAAGIPAVRGIFVRPLIDTSRADIEHFLAVQNITWRTDSTNSDEHYLRNRIRHTLMPVLHTVYPGWDNAVISGAKKALYESEAVEQFSFPHVWRIEKNGVNMALAEFGQCPPAVKIKLLYDAFNSAGSSGRVPFSFAEAVLAGKSGSACGIQVEFSKTDICVKKLINKATDSGFSAIIDKTGEYRIPCGVVTVTETVSGTQMALGCGESDTAVLSGIQLPVCVRSREMCDEIQTASGGTKSVSDILADWKVPAEQRDLIPLVQELASPEQNILCVWGSALGFDDWVVKS